MMGTTDFFEKKCIIENAMSQECKAQRKILFSEVEFLESCLEKYKSLEDYKMFYHVLHKYDDYLEIVYKLGLLREDEYLLFVHILQKHNNYLELAYKLGLLQIDEYLINMKGVCCECK